MDAITSQRKVGMSRRDMEWLVQGMLRNTPADPSALAKLLCDVMIALIEKNNAALARDLSTSASHHDEQERAR